MILGTVVGTVVSTRKMQNLVGYKLLLVEPYYGDKKDILVAGDTIGAGIGEMVLVRRTRQHSMPWTGRLPSTPSSWASWIPSRSWASNENVRI